MHIYTCLTIVSTVCISYMSGLKKKYECLLYNELFFNNILTSIYSILLWALFQQYSDKYSITSDVIDKFLTIKSKLPANLAFNLITK